ncbi:hypothetical protein CSB45_12820 [candidate division KSB3 bacterium]|uniref:Uncharacterized protein n=1 Tax=candidate division KSB3 bacterium TaxID=2044937 RepID=A0A2G6E222_9BACT|nr:MAG: hypothetical protein CSB45_12820 [candidate division KSB3 bacterium]
MYISHNFPSHTHIERDLFNDFQVNSDYLYKSPETYASFFLCILEKKALLSRLSMNVQDQK